MSAAPAKSNREDLLQEIVNSIRQWPERDRRIFAQTHYYGQSPETISRLLSLDAVEVIAILKQCDRRLYSSLRRFREADPSSYLPLQSELAGTAARDPKAKKVPVPAPRTHQATDLRRMAI